MYTKDDFLKAIEVEALKHDATAALFHAGDPRFMQMQGAMAQMFAMLSQQIEVAMEEPFLKSRDATVLADAAMKGLIFTAKPATVRIKVFNGGGQTINLNAGRYLIDATGRYYRVQAPVNVLAGNFAELSAIQLLTKIQMHTVQTSLPFYTVEVEKPKDGSSISTIGVKVNGTVLKPSYKFNGVLAGDNVFHVESDEFKRLYVKFGESQVLGVQPSAGDVIEIECGLCYGNVTPELSSAFSLQYIQASEESELRFEMLSLEVAGTDEVDIATLRELCRYPSAYDDNAVYLGEFDKLLRKQFQHLVFLSVWNEQEEEHVRGANIDNINTLFYSFALPDSSSETVDSVREQIELAVKLADNSYKLKYVAPVIEKVSCEINAVIARAYDVAQIRAQIVDVLLRNFGREAFVLKQGAVSIKHKEIAKLLSLNISALSDSRADYQVSVRNPSNSAPEVFRYMDSDSITINLTTDGYESNVWGGGATAR